MYHTHISHTHTHILYHESTLMWDLNIIAGDMVFLSHILALGGHFGRRGKSCLFCEVDSADLFKKSASKKRSLQRLCRMAHLLGPKVTFPFTCPGCNATFASQAEVDNEPAPADMTEYELQHASTAWHRRPLLDVEPTQTVL